MRLSTSIAILLTLFGAVPTSARPGKGAFLQLGLATEAPRGFVDLCSSAGAGCKDSPDVGQAAAPSASPVEMEDNKLRGDSHNALEVLARVNRLVNGNVQQRTDSAIYGRGEVWQASGIGRGAQGDCEDIAIEKRLQLTRIGFSPRHLYFAVVYARTSGLHTVLVARTSGGDYVLDSRTPYVERWDRAPYSWVSIQSMADPMRWFALGDLTSGEALVQARSALPSG